MEKLIFCNLDLLKNKPDENDYEEYDFSDFDFEQFTNKRNIFMHPKLFCCLPHRCIIIYNISCNLNGSFFDIIFQNIPL